MIGIGEQQRLGGALLSPREAMELHRALSVAGRAATDTMTRVDAYHAEEARLCAVALERHLRAAPAPTAQEVQEAPAPLRERYEELLCALLCDESPDAPGEGYAWAQARLWWLLPRWERRAPRAGSRWTDGLALIVEGVEVARAVAVASPRPGEEVTDRYKEAQVWARVDGRWRAVARSGGGVGWGAWAARALVAHTP